MKDLGWLNQWYMYPEKPESIEAQKIRKECSEKKHYPKENSGFSRCVSVVTCVECGYQYSIDSSD